jgi:hypothetical protein
VTATEGGSLIVPVGVVRQEGANAALSFPPDPAIRRALIVKLYAANYDREVERINVINVFGALARTLVQ